MAESTDASRRDSATNTTARMRPVLFYDFNRPPQADGTYLALPSELIPVSPGDSVLFGCVADDVVEEGQVIGSVGGLVRVRRV